MRKKGKLEINLRFAMGRGRRKEIFLRFGGEDRGYWGIIVKLPLNLVYIYIQIWSSLTNTGIRGFPAPTG